jgi:hypothetical protein
MANKAHDNQLDDPEKIAIAKSVKWVSIYHVTLLVIASWISIAVIYPSCCMPHALPTCFIKLKNPILCVAFGLIGGTLNASRQVIKAVKEDDYQMNRRLWQILTPIHSGIFAVVSIVFIKSGMNMATGSASNLAKGPSYLYFITITSFLVGFSTELFIKRLISATEALFGEKNNISRIGEKKSKNNQNGLKANESDDDNSNE